MRAPCRSRAASVLTVWVWMTACILPVIAWTQQGSRILMSSQGAPRLSSFVKASPVLKPWGQEPKRTKSYFQLRASNIADIDDGRKSSVSLGDLASDVSSGMDGALEDQASDLLQTKQMVQPDAALLQKQIINGIILALSFGFAFYTIFNVDQGMSRGWTQSEIAMRIPLDNWGAYESSLEESPIFTKTVINVVIYLLGDWLSQTVFQRKNILDFDALRTLRNGFIGLCFGPLVHEYYQFSDHILPVEGGIWNRVQKIIMDQTIYLSVKCSIYIMAVGLLQGDSLDTAIESVKSRLKNIVLTAWKFWPLVHCVTYSVIPAQHRILWVNCVDLLWNAILAGMSNQKVPEKETPTVLAAVDANVVDEAASLSEAQAVSTFTVTTQEIIEVSQALDQEAQFQEEISSGGGAGNATVAVAPA